LFCYSLLAIKNGKFAPINALFNNSTWKGIAESRTPSIFFNSLPFWKYRS
jgi:hypothetical protein